MAKAAPTSQATADFKAARSAHNWDKLVTSAFGKGPVISDQLSPWLSAGAGQLAQSSIYGELRSANSPDLAIFELDSVAGHSPKTLGFVTLAPSGSWSADKNDTVLFGTELVIRPSRLLASLAELAATQAYPAANTLPEALSTVVGCSKIGTLLANNSSTKGQAYAGCDGQCATALCKSALGALWLTFVDSSSNASSPLLSLNVTLSANASVDDQARPESFQGTWIGKFELGAKNLTIQGTTNASKAAIPQ